jgi:hypothetical protein
LKKSQASEVAAAMSIHKNPEVGGKVVQKLTPPATVIEPLLAEITRGQRTTLTTTDVEPSSANSSVAPALHLEGR